MNNMSIEVRDEIDERDMFRFYFFGGGGKGCLTKSVYLVKIVEINRN